MQNATSKPKQYLVFELTSVLVIRRVCVGYTSLLSHHARSIASVRQGLGLEVVASDMHNQASDRSHAFFRA